MKKIIEKAAVLIEALPYIQSFKNKIVVIKYGGSAMVDENLAESVIRDVVFMAAVGMKPVIVHGGGNKITLAMRQKGKHAEFIEGLRVTDEETMQVVSEVLLSVNQEIIATIKKFNGQGEQVLNVITAEKHFINRANEGRKLDIGYVGDIYSIESSNIIKIFKKDTIIPVLPPLGIGINDKHDYNINADLAAGAIALDLKAEKLVFITDVPGIMADTKNKDSLMVTLHADEVENLVDKGIITGGMLPKVRAGVRAVEGGVRKTHIINGTLMHSLLLEIFTDKGVGTQIISTQN